MFSLQNRKFYHTERSARYRVEKTDRPHSDGESNMSAPGLIKTSRAVNTHCYFKVAGACGGQRGGTGSVLKRKHRRAGLDCFRVWQLCGQYLKHLP